MVKQHQIRTLRAYLYFIIRAGTTASSSCSGRWPRLTSLRFLLPADFQWLPFSYIVLATFVRNIVARLDSINAI